MQVHGHDLIAGRKSFADRFHEQMASSVNEQTAMQELAGFIGNSNIVGHNVGFDMNFINAAAKRQNVKMPEADVIDTMSLASSMFGPNQLPNKKLGTIYEHFAGKPLESAHDASVDVEATNFIFGKLRSMYSA